jgi:excisionase family DNA binding protein
VAREDKGHAPVTPPQGRQPRIQQTEGVVDGGELLTVADAAVRLDRSTEQVRRYLREGRLSGRRIGGQWFIEQQALQTFGEQKRDARAFLDRIAVASLSDPLGSTIGIAAGGGSNLADGKNAYRLANWRRK